MLEFFIFNALARRAWRLRKIKQRAAKTALSDVFAELMGSEP